MSWRMRLWFWLKTKVFKVKEAEMLTWGALIVRAIIFPRSMLARWARLTAEIRYDAYGDTVTICGQEYTMELFRAWGRGGLRTEETFVLERTVDGESILIRLLGERENITEIK